MNEVLKAALAKMGDKVFIKELNGESIEVVNRMRNEEEACNSAVNKLLNDLNATRKRLFNTLFEVNNLDRTKQYAVEAHASGKIALYEVANAVPTEQLPVQESGDKDSVQELPAE